MQALGIKCIVGGCPLMYRQPDFGQRCMRWQSKFGGKVPE
jgi:hypothetical protein